MEKKFDYKYKGVRPKKEDNKGVIILLHGYGDNIINFSQSFNNIFPSEYFVVTLQAPYELELYSNSDSYGWCDISFIDGVKTYDSVQMESSRKLIIDFIEYIKTCYEIDTDNVILFGNSQGAVLTQSVALTSPDSIKAVVALSGYIKMGSIKNIDTPNNIQKLDFFIGHGSLDQQVPIDLDRISKDYLESIGAKLEYHEYPIGHTISNDELKDVVNWINKLK